MDGLAWATWEMSEIKRIGGDLVGAREELEKARLLFESVDDPTIPVFLQRSLGDIAQMSGDYLTALKHFEASLQGAKETNHEWAQIYAICGIGRAEITLGDTGAAQTHFSQALHTAIQICDLGIMLVALAGS